MPKVTIILRRPPYGDINAAEALRHALGAITTGYEVNLIMVDGGVLTAKKGHKEEETGFTNLENTLKDCLDMGIKTYADKVSMKENYLDLSMIIDGIEILNSHEVSEIVKESDKVMIF